MICENLETELTLGYLEFLETKHGTGIELALSWDEADITRIQQVKCEAEELPETLAKWLGEFANKDPEIDPDFNEEITDISHEIINCCNDNEVYTEFFYDCKIKADGISHPLNKACQIRA